MGSHLPRGWVSFQRTEVALDEICRADDLGVGYINQLLQIQRNWLGDVEGSNESPSRFNRSQCSSAPAAR